MAANLLAAPATWCPETCYLRQATEEWRAVAGFPDYMVSSLGRVKSLPRKRVLRERVLRPTPNGDGYLKLGLIRDGRQRSRVVHRLVAEAFLPNPDALPVVDHIDGCRQNNAVSNLRWVSHSGNAKNTWRLRTRQRRITEKTRQAAIKLRATGMTKAAVAAELRIGEGTVSQLLAGNYEPLGDPSGRTKPRRTKRRKEV